MSISNQSVSTSSLNTGMEKIGRYRWTICALVFFATTVNYLDRAVISLLKSTLSEEFNWTDAHYANIELAFKISYAIGLLAQED